jgi:thiamine monophosphate kinase
MRAVRARVLTLSAAAMFAAPAFAHHSFASFDQSKQVTLKGVVREFQWTNPHSWLQLKVVNADGVVEEWSIEMISPSVLGRMGWKRNSIKAGDEVVVVINPVRDGAHGGNMISVTGTDGRRIGGPAQ